MEKAVFKQAVIVRNRELNRISVSTLTLISGCFAFLLFVCLVHGAEEPTFVNNMLEYFNVLSFISQGWEPCHPRSRIWLALCIISHWKTYQPWLGFGGIAVRNVSSMLWINLQASMSAACFLHRKYLLFRLAHSYLMAWRLVRLLVPFLFCFL